MEQEINLDELTDMNLLQNLLDQTEDIDDRKAIRSRIQELRSIERAKRDEKLARLTNTREDMLIERQRKAAEHKQRTLAMYDNMARSAPAGGKKTMDIGILQTGQITPPSTPSVRESSGDSQDILLQCKQAAEDRKKKIPASYEAAARSAPAGATKTVDMQEFIKADVSNYQPIVKPESTATFQMCGGIPKVSKGSAPGTPMSPGFPGGLSFPKVTEEKPDPAQEFIRARQREAEENKRRLLKAYDYVSRQGAGPKQILVEELSRIDISSSVNDDRKPPAACGTAHFRGGIRK